MLRMYKAQKGGSQVHWVDSLKDKEDQSIGDPFPVNAAQFQLWAVIPDSCAVRRPEETLSH